MRITPSSKALLPNPPIFEKLHRGYRYHFNGKSFDNEINGWQDYGERMYNTLTGRFPTADPLIVKGQQYAWYSPYQFAGNDVIRNIDIDGLEPVNYPKPSENENGINTSAIDNNRAGYTPEYYSNKFHTYFITNEKSFEKEYIPNSTILSQHNTEGLSSEFQKKQQQTFANKQQIADYLKRGQSLYPTQFGGGDFGYGTNIGIVDGMKEVPTLLAPELISAKILSYSKPLLKFNQYSKATKGIYSGPFHQSLRGVGYQSYKSTIKSFNQSLSITKDLIDFSSKAIDVQIIFNKVESNKKNNETP